MTKRITGVLVAFLLFSSLFWGMSPQGFSAWRKTIQKFSGANNFYVSLLVKTHLKEDSGEWIQSTIGFEAWCRNLRDYRLGFTAPSFLQGITLFYLFESDHFTVLDTTEKLRAEQRVNSSQGLFGTTPGSTPALLFDGLSPKEILEDIGEYLLVLVEKPNPLVKIEDTFHESTGTFSFDITLTEMAGFALSLSLFPREYPDLRINLDEDFYIQSMEMVNPRTNESLKLEILELDFDPGPEVLRQAFSIDEREYPLIEYITNSN
ncbi:MAG TPA: hypothetical protein P5560_06970 [Thermotogota bacterium]|nr:hypothetical protein [Thermotogota bacterium]HRW92667.1 hypothetical protein [Thermotogota bacterium]